MGNTCLYGATGGELYVNGRAGGPLPQQGCCTERAGVPACALCAAVSCSQGTAVSRRLRGRRLFRWAACTSDGLHARAAPGAGSLLRPKQQPLTLQPCRRALCGAQLAGGYRGGRRGGPLLRVHDGRRGRLPGRRGPQRGRRHDRRPGLLLRPRRRLPRQGALPRPASLPTPCTVPGCMCCPRPAPRWCWPKLPATVMGQRAPQVSWRCAPARAILALARAPPPLTR